ncbi:ribosome silencing factor [Fulvimarina endophytica]|uniref:Ribosomal silencing factor RsfS n=1 Tax=Fulvimarina endophytica TaxID=2293836 RepID=A0A371WYH0_9HYPH|nr:ribosome silencing factor [Fulvimarina endophytica]RFC62047.1 ribosome silencing factor [Fulvimarina endophytica]
MTEAKSGTTPTASETPASGASDGVSVLQHALRSLEDSKAENIVSIDMRGKSALADHMLIVSGRSHRHVSAVCDHLIKDLKQAGVKTPKVEGLQTGDWVLIDTGDMIIHVFRPEVREFYNLEKMWSVGGDHQVATVH